MWRASANFLAAGAIFILAPAVFSEPSPTPEPVAPEAQRHRESLPKGPINAKVDGDRVTLTADKAWKVGILNEIGRQVGFRAVGGNVSKEPVSLKLQGVLIEEAIRQISAPEPYWLGYEYEPAKKKYAIRFVFIGPRGLAAANVLNASERSNQVRQQRQERAKKAQEQRKGAAGTAEERNLDPFAGQADRQPKSQSQ